MRTAILPIHQGLSRSSRLPALRREGQDLRAMEIALLLLTGVGATLASAFLDFSLRIPGHAIIRAVFPMAFGLALAPRQMAGMVMGAGAVASAMVIKVGGFGAIGLGAMTSLTLTGPLLDLALWRARRGGRLYLGFALAGLGANLAALALRGGSKAVGVDHAGGRLLAEWLPQAIATYALCGLLAGLISAGVWFQFAGPRNRVTRNGAKREAAG